MCVCGYVCVHPCLYVYVCVRVCGCMYVWVRTDAPTYKGQSSLKVRTVPMAHLVPLLPIARPVSRWGGEPIRHGGVHSVKDDWPLDVGVYVRRDVSTYKGQSSFKVRTAVMAYGVPHPHSETGLTMGGGNPYAVEVRIP